MADLTVTDTVPTGGFTVSFTSAAAGGDKFSNQEGATVLIAKNDDASATTITITAQDGPDGQTITNPTQSVGASDIDVLGPFPARWFNDSDGKVNVTYSSVTSLTVAAVRFKGAT